MSAVDPSFASDNTAGVHPRLLQAIAEANLGAARPYGGDALTARALATLRGLFGVDCEVALVWNGTGANVLALAALARPFEAVLCTETSHIAVDECGAPERFGGFKLLDIPTPDGKLTPELVRPQLKGFGDMHHVQPRVLSITQSSELGTVYRLEEIRSLAELAHAHGMLLHVDGARIANAAAALECTLAAITRDCGVDALSLGVTKNGGLAGEAVVFFPSAVDVASGSLPFLRKQSTQLASKMRFVAAQIVALFEGELWRENAAHANRMARCLAAGLEAIAGIELARPVEANAVFVRVPKAVRERLLESYLFHVWDEASDEVRWMTSFATREADVERFLTAIRAAARCS